MVIFNVDVSKEEDLNLIKIIRIAFEMKNDENSKIIVERIKDAIPIAIDDDPDVICSGAEPEIIGNDIVFREGLVLEKGGSIKIKITPRSKKYFTYNVLEREFRYYPMLIFKREGFDYIAYSRPSFYVFPETEKFELEENFIKVYDLDILDSFKIGDEFLIRTGDQITFALSVRNNSRYPIYLKDAKVPLMKIKSANVSGFSDEEVRIDYVLHPNEEHKILIVATPIEKNQRIKLEVSYAPFNFKENLLYAQSEQIFISLYEGKQPSIENPSDFIFETLNIRKPEFRANLEKSVNLAKNVLSFVHAIFPDYTSHGIDHSLRIIKKIRELIDNDVIELTEYERYLLAQAVLFHDVGMSLPGAFYYYKKHDHLAARNAQEVQTYLLGRKEEIRRRHQVISYEYIIDNHKKLYLSSEEAKIVAEIAKLHRLPKDYERDPILDTKEIVTLNKKEIRPKYMAAVMRLCDEIDLGRQRIMDNAFSILEGILDEENIRHFKTHYKVEDVKIKFDNEARVLILILLCEERLGDYEFSIISKALSKDSTINAMTILDISDLGIELRGISGGWIITKGSVKSMKESVESLQSTKTIIKEAALFKRSREVLCNFISQKEVEKVISIFKKVLDMLRVES